MPPSDEGGGFCVAKDEGREKSSKLKAFLSLSHLTVTAPSSEGAEDLPDDFTVQVNIY